MVLIADSGSTKTDWALLSVKGEVVSSFSTPGLNPYHQEQYQIENVLRQVGDQVAACKCGDSQGLNIYFYGSGVRSEQETFMIALLRDVFPQACLVEAHSDLLGAAHALCGHNAGIISILGTGSNSCLYDGQRILQHTPALGYILGDEGGGAALGKRFLHDLYGGVLSEEIRDVFKQETALTLPDILERVYKQPQANCFLASLSEFIHAHLSDPAIETIVMNNFSDFVRYHIAPYGRNDLPLSFVGSIACHYRQLLAEVVSSCGYTLGSILHKPIEGLVNYYSNHDM